MDHRTRRSPARFLAPLALIAVIVAFMSIVNGSGGSGSNSGDTSAVTTTTSTAKKKAATKRAVRKKKAAAKAQGSKTYTIQIGDTLQGIADKTGVTLERLQELNPNVDPRSMTAGQQIKLQ